jgi:hypothetical protein
LVWYIAVPPFELRQKFDSCLFIQKAEKVQPTNAFWSGPMLSQLPKIGVALKGAIALSFKQLISMGPSDSDKV